jgi:hypothetical protein
MMTIPEILKELETYNGRFPQAAMAAAMEQREAVTPELLRVLEAVAAEPALYTERTDYMLHLYALFLLAQFRETRAYAPIVKILNAPGESSDDLIGETIAEGMNRILASVYDGDPAPLHGLIENEAAYEFARAAALDALVTLVHTDQMTRAEVAGYLRSLFQEKLERTNSYIWDRVAGAVVDLPAPELLPEVRRAFADGLADPWNVPLEDIERDLAAQKLELRERPTLITDAIAEMEWWAAFDPDEPWPRPPAAPPEPPQERPFLPPLADHPMYTNPELRLPVRREPKVGRNEPCPCGSGKKYKKCCGRG